MSTALTNIAELINFDYTGDSRAEFGPVDTIEWWAMFANIKESTRIYLRIDSTHYDQYRMFDE